MAANGLIWMPQPLKILCLVQVERIQLSHFQPPPLWGNKNWPLDPVGRLTYVDGECRREQPISHNPRGQGVVQKKDSTSSSINDTQREIPTLGQSNWTIFSLLIWFCPKHFSSIKHAYQNKPFLYAAECRRREGARKWNKGNPCKVM